MLNIEKYKDEIRKIMSSHGVPGISKDGKPVACTGESCKECRFTTDDGLCDGDERFIDWCLEDDGQEEDCIDCRHNGTITCNDCSHSHKSMFERKPKKTRQSEFLKMFPNVELKAMEDCDVVSISPCILDYKLGEQDQYDVCKRNKKCGSCTECFKAYWNEEVE